jgi:hypothetical protein
VTTNASQPRPVPPPMCDQAEFDELMTEMVADETPRLFAIVHELGERADGWIAAWGLAFPDHVDLISTRGLTTASSPEHALQKLTRRRNLTPHLVWVTSERTAS